MYLAQNLKYLMDQRGLTLTRLSKETGIPKQTLHNWLCGAKPGNIEQIVKISKYFNLSIETLIAYPFFTTLFGTNE